MPSLANYNDNPKQTLTEPDTKKLEAIHHRLSMCNSQYVSMLSQLEDKLHKILDKRTPEKGLKGEQKVSTDFNSSVNEQLDYYEQHNMYLERLLNHLNEIV
jgi:NAD+--asparagine ADP-ribosyltransferase